jgi:hypothetical protein
MCLAAGYPDEHKETTIIAGKEMLVSPMASVVAEIANDVTRDERIITLSSRLEKPHGYYFSGMSGGAIYAVETDRLAPAGILFEGYPSTKEQDSNRAGSPAFLDENDIFFRALMLTPEIFLDWLERAKLS